jgi:gluconolactonase
MTGMRALILILLLGHVIAVETHGLVAPDATPKEVGGDFSFTAGAAVGQDGRVFFADVPTSRILALTPDGAVAAWREDSGGARGLQVHMGRVYACQQDRRQVVAFAADGAVEPLSYLGAGKRFNSPYALWVDADGGVYFTDPDDAHGTLEQSGEFAWYIAPGVAEARQVAKDFSHPTGIIGTPNGGSLYLADQGAATVWKFSIDVPGHLADRMRFCNEGSAGMCLDEKGNVYLTWRRGIQVYAPDGTKLGTIAVPVDPTSVCFGGPTRSTLVITGGAKVLTLEMAVHGVE